LPQVCACYRFSSTSLIPKPLLKCGFLQAALHFRKDLGIAVHRSCFFDSMHAKQEYGPSIECQILAQQQIVALSKPFAVSHPRCGRSHMYPTTAILGAHSTKLQDVLSVEKKNVSGRGESPGGETPRESFSLIPRQLQALVRRHQGS